MRSILYNKEKKVVGHKIDLRFVVNSYGASDIDVGAIETANELPSESKKKHDAAKLLIESKDIVDLAANSTIRIDDIRVISGTGFQIGGSSAYSKYQYP
jgi:hypothetical protein